MSPLSGSERARCRRQILANIDEQDEAEDLLERAHDELKARLADWYGDFAPAQSQYYKSRTLRSNFSSVRVLADPMELVIIRAISLTFPAAQFGVSPNGDIFTARGNGWTIKGPRIYVAQLSWLLDEAADLFNHLRGGAGGRFFEQNGQFFMAENKSTFMHVVTTAGEVDLTDQISLLRHPQRIPNPDLERGNSLTPQSARRSHVARQLHCSLHNVALTPTGTCDSCADLISTKKSDDRRQPSARKTPPNRPWWRFW